MLVKASKSSTHETIRSRNRSTSFSSRVRLLHTLFEFAATPDGFPLRTSDFMSKLSTSSKTWRQLRVSEARLSASLVLNFGLDVFSATLSRTNLRPAILINLQWRMTNVDRTVTYSLRSSLTGLGSLEGGSRYWMQATRLA